ncbi:hypothetical protein JOF29_001705 [Kribbella aluminosa]|uniref:DUF4097 domain-containing protein n=1 Tax=Kribbella aluminosa TaxID=416017 RepID=A0ABS4UG47_9ACTN|nr:DUF4097 family beta strand repeat-containing protein [Kribbella aluminosa]MBP2350622.1 hypothetical protein [Kribbella aluminosa]
MVDLDGVQLISLDVLPSEDAVQLLVLAGASAARRGAMTVVAGAGTGVYRAELAGPLEPVEIRVDRAGSTLAVQSWYAGVYAVTTGAAGALVTHRVHRVVPGHPGFADAIADLGLRARVATWTKYWVSSPTGSAADTRPVTTPEAVSVPRLPGVRPVFQSGGNNKVRNHQKGNTMSTFNTPKAISAVLNIPAGRIQFVAAERTDTAVQVRPLDPSKGRDVKAAEATQVEYADGVLRITVVTKNQYFGPSGSLAVQVELPAGSQVEVKAASAELQTTGTLGAVVVESSHGSINLADVASARVTTVAGDVSIGHLNGPAEVRTSKGDIRIAEAVQGALELRTDVGEIEVGAAAGVSAALDAGTTTGRISNSLKNSETAQLTIQATTTVGDIVAHSL